MTAKMEVKEKKKVGRPPSRKALLTLRLEPEIVDYYRATGPGWLQRVNDTLKQAMPPPPPPAPPAPPSPPSKTRQKIRQRIRSRMPSSQKKQAAE